MPKGVYNRPLTCGVGINDKIGWTTGTKYQQKVYYAWHDMLSRCYDSNNEFYYCYGAQGVTVCDRWLRFSNFVEDIPKLVGWAAWKVSGPREYALEKDIIQWGQSKLGKVYSPQTCFFTNVVNNTIEKNYRCGNPIILGKYKLGQPCGVNYPNGFSVESFGFNELARQIGCVPGLVIRWCKSGYVVPRGKFKGCKFYLK